MVGVRDLALYDITKGRFSDIHHANCAAVTQTHKHTLTDGGMIP